MKILQINVVADKGSTGKIVYELHQQLTYDGHKSIVCYGRGKNLKDPGIYKVAPETIMKLQSLRSKLTGYAYTGCFMSTNNLLKIIQNESPDIVHLHCLNGYFVNIYKLMKFLKNNEINTVLTLHAEFMFTGGCGNSIDCEKWKTGCQGICPQKGSGRPSSKIFNRSSKEWKMMAEAFNGFENMVLVPVSDWLENRAKESPFLIDKKFMVITNGLDTATFSPKHFKKIKEKHNLKDEKILLHVTPNFKNPIKGGRYVLDIANRLKNENVKVIIIGFNGDPSELPKNIICIKHTVDQNELAKYYSMADLTLLTSKSETFSMVCAESLSCGTPVVGFKAGGPETISIKKYTEFVDQGNIDALETSVIKWLTKKRQFGTEISQEARKVYDKKEMLNKYISLYTSLMGDKGGD